MTDDATPEYDFSPPYDYDYGPTGPLAPLFARLADGYPKYMMTPPFGWIDLVLQLDRDLSQVVPDYTIAQVKEKFAGLRYYIGSFGIDPEDPGYDEAYDKANELVREAERKSYTICQFCGEPGTLDDSQNWVVTACEAHRTDTDTATAPTEQALEMADRKIVLPGSEGYWKGYETGRALEDAFPGQDAVDFAYACEYNDMGPLTSTVGVAGLLMVEQGENDGGNWVWLVHTSDDALWWAVGGCDYTGWDCQSFLSWYHYGDDDSETP